MKTHVYEGGIRSPFWMRWPNRLKPESESDRIAAHIDVMPTILDACGLEAPAGVQLDGRSLLPFIGKTKPPNGRTGTLSSKVIAVIPQRSTITSLFAISAGN